MVKIESDALIREIKMQNLIIRYLDKDQLQFRRLRNYQTATVSQGLTYFSNFKSVIFDLESFNHSHKYVNKPARLILRRAACE
jgi:hypothetical protein